VIVTDKDVERVAELANLDLTPEEQSRMLHDLNSVLDYIAQLNELDTCSVLPMAQVSDSAAAELRPDTVRPSLSRAEVLRSAPDTDGIFFKVPKVIER
jgi:aspartyl-tRNA(Asn)/glutamyl-tRNA(Gln) amidotransferase subunit C